MGGINPDRPPPPRPRSPSQLPQAAEGLEATWRHSRALFLSTSQFFASHAALEDAVIAEGTGDSSAAAESVTVAQDSMRAAVGALTDGMLNLSSNRDFLTGNPQAEWYANYFPRQEEGLERLRELADQLAVHLDAQSINTATEIGGLQESLWHAGANHEIRLLSIDYLRELVELIGFHISTVEETND